MEDCDVTKYASNNLQALGECLGLCETRGVDPRIIARLILDLVAYEGKLKVPVGFLELPEAPAEGESWVYPDLQPKTDDDPDEPNANYQAERDDRGRKVVKRDREWRTKTLESFGNCPATAEQLAMRCQTTPAAMSMRLNALKREGVVAQCEPRGYWRRVEVTS
jgi:hypothetical protein